MRGGEHACDFIVASIPTLGLVKTTDLASPAPQQISGL